eukprot:3427334-Pyramimonas_sp.AAC.1
MPEFHFLGASGASGSLQYSCIGGVQADVENVLGSLLHRMLLERGLWAPAASVASARSNGAARFSPKFRESRKGERLDYVVCSLVAAISGQHRRAQGGPDY